MSGKPQIVAGFMPLLDSAVLVAAKVKGFADAEGLDLALVRETSWANIRDRMAVGHFQVAHVLAPMPIASNLGLTPLAVSTIAPMALGLGGNAITVSNELWARMVEHGAAADFDPARAGRALKQVVAARAARSEPVLRFAVVHPYSGHNYELRYWLAACGIDPAQEVDIVIVPPPLMADALASGAIDGYCVGEPWEHRRGAARARSYRHRQGRHLALEPGKGLKRWGEVGPGQRRCARRSAARAVPFRAMVRATRQSRGAGADSRR